MRRVDTSFPSAKVVSSISASALTSLFQSMIQDSKTSKSPHTWPTTQPRTCSRAAACPKASKSHGHRIKPWTTGCHESKMKQFFEALDHCLAVTREQPHKVKPSREGTLTSFHLFHRNLPRLKAATLQFQSVMLKLDAFVSNNSI